MLLEAEDRFAVVEIIPGLRDAVLGRRFLRRAPTSKRPVPCTVQSEDDLAVIVVEMIGIFAVPCSSDAQLCSLDRTILIVQPDLSAALATCARQGQFALL